MNYGKRLRLTGHPGTEHKHKQNCQNSSYFSCLQRTAEVTIAESCFSLTAKPSIADYDCAFSMGNQLNSVLRAELFMARWLDWRHTPPKELGLGRP